MLVHSGSVAEGDRFLAERWPEVAAVADPEKVLYADFGLRRGGLRQLLGPAVWLSGLRAATSGHGIGKPAGDPRQMSGHFLVKGGTVHWGDVHDHAGSPLRLDEVAERARALG